MQIFKCLIFLSLFNNFLNLPLPQAKEVYQESFDLSVREYRDIMLYNKNIGNIKFIASLPKKIKGNEKVIILLNGLETGKKVLNYIPQPTNYIIIAYEFPKNLKRIKNKSILFHPLSTRKAAMDVPFQIVSIIKWLDKQSWYKKNEISLIGISIGAIFVPVTLHLAQNHNIKLGPTIIAYGGADLYSIFYANLKNYKFLREPLASLGYLLFKPIDPKFHMPFIHSKFLIINGQKDSLIPFKSAQKLQELTPEPKTIINLNSDHIDPEKKALIHQITQISLDWLENN